MAIMYSYLIRSTRVFGILTAADGVCKGVHRPALFRSSPDRYLTEGEHSQTITDLERSVRETKVIAILLSSKVQANLQGY